MSACKTDLVFDVVCKCCHTHNGRFTRAIDIPKQFSCTACGIFQNYERNQDVDYIAGNNMNGHELPASSGGGMH
jgi:hypothetical protein